MQVSKKLFEEIYNNTKKGSITMTIKNFISTVEKYFKLKSNSKTVIMFQSVLGQVTKTWFQL